MNPNNIKIIFLVKKKIVKKFSFFIVFVIEVCSKRFDSGLAASLKKFIPNVCITLKLTRISF